MPRPKSLSATFLRFMTTLNMMVAFIAVVFSASFSVAAAENQAHKICAIYPHLKDSYWLSVNYGMVSEAQKQHVELRVLEAGGYPNKIKQQQQLSLCTRWGANAIILGTVSPDAYFDNLSNFVGSTPIFATVNKLLLNEKQNQLLKGVVGVDWYWMGYEAGRFLADSHPKGSGVTNIAFLPGPKTSGGTKPATLGFYDALKGSDINIVASYWADNDKELQRNLVQKVIDIPNIQYIVGSAVAIEAAVSELRAAKKTGDIKLVSTYLSHGIYRGLLRNRVEFAPTDQMVQQGRLSMMQAIHFLNDENYVFDIAPDIEPITPKTLQRKVIENSLSPSEYRPTFSIK